MILPIITDPNPILHQEAEVITEITPAITGLIANMRETMKGAQGVGLAAPQVGTSISLSVIGYDDPEEPEYSIPHLVLINPRITWKSQKKVSIIEACLSIPDVEGPVIRPDRIRLKAKNEHFEPIELEAEGYVARVIQHEVDHLHGHLFTEYVPKKKLIKRTTPEYPRV